MTAANHPMAWADQGACRGEDPDLFFPVNGAGFAVEVTAAHVDRVRPICQACPVYASCHAWAVEHETEGIWVATSPKDRRRLHRTARRKTA